MTLPASGTITFLQIKNEYGGSNRLLDYYRGGTYVPNITQNANVPTSGTITAKNFYGGAKIFLPSNVTNAMSGGAINATSVAASGSGTYVIANTTSVSSVLSSSTNGTSVTPRLTVAGVFTNVLTIVDYVNGTFIATGSRGNYAYSTDGISWTMRTIQVGTGANTSTFFQLGGVAYVGGLYVIAGSNQYAANSGPCVFTASSLTSNTGWTQRPFTGLGTDITLAGFGGYGNAAYRSIAYNGTTVTVLCMSTSNGNFITATSTNGTTWTSRLESAFAPSFFRGGGQWDPAAIATDGTSFYSITPIGTLISAGSSGTPWSNNGLLIADTVNFGWCIKYVNNVYVATGRAASNTIIKYATTTPTTLGNWTTANNTALLDITYDSTVGHYVAAVDSSTSTGPAYQ